MKHLWGLILAFALFTGAVRADNQDLRSKIGSTFSSPVLVGDLFYFVATTGVLFEASKDFKTIKKLYEGNKQTLGALVVVNDKLIWGEGLHTDKKTLFHIFDIKTKKMLKEIEIKGHIQRPPLFIHDTIYLPTGPGGILAINATTYKTKWHTKTHNKKDLHIDSNILAVENQICATSVYEFKGIVCLDEKSGKVLQTAELTRNPKSEITLWNNQIVGFATEADLSKPKWDIPSDLYVYDIKNNKMKMSKELRGFNFFAPQINGDEAFVTLSTGDFILVNLTNGKIHFLGEFPEPFTNNAFIKGLDFCGIGIMGKYMCYGKTTSGYALTVDKRLMETVVGEIMYLDSQLITPSRAGYYIE